VSSVVTKHCLNCDKRKPALEFYESKTAIDGLRSWCKSCTKAAMRTWHAKNREAVSSNHRKYYNRNRAEILARQRSRQKAIREYNRDYYQRNRDKELVRQRGYYESHKEEISRKKRSDHSRQVGRKWRQKQSESNPQYRIARNLRTRLYMAIRNGTKQGSAVRDLGCSLSGFMAYMHDKFEPEMTWENYGSEWHIDHIRPLSSFDLTDREQIKQACHYTNLQPLWKSANLRKGAWTSEVA